MDDGGEGLSTLVADVKVVWSGVNGLALSTIELHAFPPSYAFTHPPTFPLSYPLTDTHISLGLFFSTTHLSEAGRALEWTEWFAVVHTTYR